MFRYSKLVQNATLSRGLHALCKQKCAQIGPSTTRCLSTRLVNREDGLLGLSTSRGYESRRNNSGAAGGGFNRLYVVGGIVAGIGIVGALLYDGSGDTSKEKKSKAKGKNKQVQEEEEPVIVIPKVPVPESVTYLIIGAGTAAMTASKTIRKNDPAAKVLMVTQERHRPYMRPPLSKELWFNGSDADKLTFKDWAGKMKDVFYQPEEYFLASDKLAAAENGGTAIAYGRKVAKLDVVEQKATFADGDSIKYDKCLIATGGKPRNLNVFSKLSGQAKRRVHLFRNIDDFTRLHKATDSAMSVMVVGGGFLGSELAVALSQKAKDRDLKVSQVFPEKGNMGLVFPEYLSRWSTDKVTKEGVTVYPESFVIDCSFNQDSRQLELVFNTGEKVSTDQVVVAVGLEPNTELATSSGLELDPTHGGFLVNAELEARRNLWVAGDAACFYDINLGRRRVEHHDHAVVSGRLAGDNMTGAGKPYWHQSMFWSDLGPSIGYEAIGICDASLPTFAVFAKATDQDTPAAVVKATGEGIRSETETEKTSVAPSSAPDIPVPHTPREGQDYGKGVIFYLRDDKVVGMVLWNMFGRMPVARQVLKDAKSGDDLTKIAQAFDIYDLKKKESEAKKAEKSNKK